MVTGSGNTVTISEKEVDITEEDGPTRAMEGPNIAEKTKKADHLNHVKAEEKDDHLDNAKTKKGRAILGRGGAVQVYKVTNGKKIKIIIRKQN